MISNSTRIDRLARRLAEERPRRSVLSLLAAATSVLLASGSEPARAACKKVGKKCDKNKDCCQGAKCKGGKRGRCRCKSGRKDCLGNGTCVNLNTDKAHCGDCGIVCIPPEQCCDGVCSTICAQ